MDLLSTARRWHDAGLQVVPTNQDGTKRPFGSWATFQNRRLEWTQTQALLEQHQDTGGIGVILGIPSNIEMIELEGRANSEENLKRMTEVAQKLGIFEAWIELNGGCVEKTPNGGLHFFVRCEEPIGGNEPLARDQEGKVLAETRGQGGFCVVTPSTGRKGHPEGSDYSFETGGPESIPTVTKAQLDLLHDVFRSIGVDDPPPTQPSTPAQKPTSLRPGDDYAAKTTWAEILEPHGWQLSHTDSQNQHWVRPNKRKQDGSSATANDKYLYVFSTSVPGFSANKAYDKFAVYSILEHAGNHQQAAKTLASRGFGDALAVGGGAEGEPTQESVTPLYSDLSDFEGQELIVEPVEIFDVFYRGRLNGIYGDPECGKTWLALAACASELKLGNKVVFLDLDANGAVTLAKRLKALGVPESVISSPESFRHYAPADDEDFKACFADILAFSPDFVVIDSFGELLPLLGKDSNSNDDVSDVLRLYITPLTTDQAGVLVIDHLPKNFEARSSGYAIGASAKKRRMDGSYLLINATQGFAPGTVGVAEVHIRKDRLGGLRAKHPNTRGFVGYFCLDSTGSPMQYSLSDQNLGFKTDNERRQMEVLKVMATNKAHDWTQAELVSETGMNHKQLRPIIEDLADEELIVRVGRSGNSNWPIRINHSGLAKVK